MSLVKQSAHPNIISLKEIILIEDKLSLIFEYCEYDLMKYMVRHQITPKIVKVFSYSHFVIKCCKQLIIAIHIE